MKQKLLLTLFIASINLAVNAQKSATYAITGTQKGSNNWTEVRLVDVTSGEELKTIFKSSEETQLLNARTGKPIAKKDLKPENLQVTRYTTDGNTITISGDNVRIIRVSPDGNTVSTPGTPVQTARVREMRDKVLIELTQNGGNSAAAAPALQAARVKDAIKEVLSENKVLTEHKVLVENIARARAKTDVNVKTYVDVNTNVNVNTNTTTRTYTLIKDRDGQIQVHGQNILVRMGGPSQSFDKPFSTYSAACAYDKKHERLYYTPLGIAQLRYIDLKAKTPTVFYFEDEQFGALRGRGDLSNQITRMVIGADGNGYALTNNAEHLIQFTTDKKATITDLGALIDDPSNGNFTVHNPGGYGGDIIAAKSGDLYLIMANHNIFQIDIKSMVATYKGSIQGLPRGYTTNGAAVEEGTMVLVNSSNSTQGYYHFDINKLAAEKVSSSENVYNASDLANGNLLAVKKDKKEEQPQQVIPAPVVSSQAVEMAPIKNIETGENTQETRLAVFPNPVTNHIVNLLLDNYTAGKYQAKLIDVSGKQLGSKSFTISTKSHTEQFNLPHSIAKGNYLIQLYDQSTKSAGVVKLVVQ